MNARVPTLPTPTTIRAMSTSRPVQQAPQVVLRGGRSPELIPPNLPNILAEPAAT